MSERPLVRVAAQNNAEWCDAFCRTHGIVGHFRADYWFSRVRTPRYYPDAVTLLPEVTIEQVLSGIDTSEGCSVKDSFAGLNLAAAGFRPLLRADWVTREPAESRVQSARGWSVLTTAEQLGEWEAAWAGFAEGAGFFKPSLLGDETIGVLAGYEGDRIVAGAIANRSSTAIGLSNVFDVAGDLESAWVGAAAIAAGLWGEMPTVGYDSGASLEAAHAGGFKTIGELVVWLNGDSSPESRQTNVSPPKGLDSASLVFGLTIRLARPGRGGGGTIIVPSSLHAERESMPPKDADPSTHCRSSC